MPFRENVPVFVHSRGECCEFVRSVSAITRRFYYVSLLPFLPWLPRVAAWALCCSSHNLSHSPKYPSFRTNQLLQDVISDAMYIQTNVAPRWLHVASALVVLLDRIFFFLLFSAASLDRKVPLCMYASSSETRSRLESCRCIYTRSSIDLSLHSSIPRQINDVDRI
jgi:hypothetical protein